VTIWIDAQLSPALARWFDEVLGIRAIAVRDLGLRDATVEPSSARLAARTRSC